MITAFIIFPNNLFKSLSPLGECGSIFLIEEFLFFRQYKFHKQKLLFHRASMKAYESYLQTNNFNVSYINAIDELADIRLLIPFIKQQGFEKIIMYDPCDEWLEQRTRKACSKSGLNMVYIESPLFINSRAELNEYLTRKKNYFQTDFYVYQRKLRNKLIDKNSNPLNGKWSFDAENRLKYPVKKRPPSFKEKYYTEYHRAAQEYIEEYFSANHGELNAAYYYPVTFEQAEIALADFLQSRFADFGIYQDAIVEDAIHLNHSVLSALLNTGLLLPMEVIDTAIGYAFKNNIPYNSLEGLVRQILGWREYIRMLYIKEGNKQRTRNYWNFKRKIPASFYEGSTGIRPIDATIKKLKQTAYNHHIERLMILSNFMLLCEFDPDEVYRWFMEMYIDAYDWVMVPNIYGMGQFSDGGIMSTKPYISGSNYIFKMSNYKKGERWAEIWDALFWRFMHLHRFFFLQNPRLSMLVETFDKWDQSKKNDVLQKAEMFLNSLDQ